jgi:hypothetical protein
LWWSVLLAHARRKSWPIHQLLENLNLCVVVTFFRPFLSDDMILLVDFHTMSSADLEDYILTHAVFFIYNFQVLYHHQIVLQRPVQEIVQHTSHEIVQSP